MDGDEDDCAPKDLTHATSAYRRALVTVVALNLAMGVGELVAGLFAGSQALKADSLDFLGDGLITLIGLLAIRWGPRWRARSALLQGGFLAVLAVGILASAVYRAFVQRTPEAEVMGIVGLLALATNVAAALLLLPHRKGDSGVRAVWLFSRNDAIGNAAVIAAAGLVYWTGTVWSDLTVAAAIAALFLHSSAQIVRSAVADLRAPPVGIN